MKVQGEAGITSPQVKGYTFRQGGAALVAVPEGRCIVGSSYEERRWTITVQCPGHVKKLELRVAAGNLKGSTLLFQAAEWASVSPGKDGEESAHTQDSWPRRVPKSHTSKLLCFSASPEELHHMVEEL